jgi:ATP-dependent RNA helicase DeaD
VNAAVKEMQTTEANQEEEMKSDRGKKAAVAIAAKNSTRSSGGGYSRLFVNLGTKDGFFKASFLQFILDMSDLKKELGKIDMKDMTSWIEIEKGAAHK